MTHFLTLFVIISATALIVYKLLLKKEKAFVFNRFYLLFSIVLAFSLPFIEFENNQLDVIVSSNELIKQSITFETPQVFANKGETITINEKSEELYYTLGLFLYSSVTLLFLIRFLNNLWRLKQLIVKNKLLTQEVNIVLLEDEISPFSFFNYLFLNKKNYNSGLVSNTIIRHETIHSKQYHSLDVLFIELLISLFWFNPFLWFYKKEISENHEYLADNELIKEGLDLIDYSNQIIQSIASSTKQQLVCGFSFIQTKNRIKMLNKKKSSLLKIGLKLSFVLFSIGGIIFLSSYRYTEPKKPYVVIIDAGHGGKDDGATNKHALEKDITLSVVEQLMIADKDPEIKLIFTRKGDQFLSLIERVEFANSRDADLFISLHANSASPSVNGLEIYLPEDSIANERSAEAGQIMAMYVAQSNYKEFRIKQASFLLLKEIRHPSFFIELGYLTNEHDLKLITNEKSINSIANSIYRGLIDLKEGNTSIR